MPYLVRSIKPERWGEEAATIPADGVTKDLKTEGNAVSLWFVSEPAEEELEEVALALAATREKLAPVDLAVVPLERLEREGLRIRTTPGRTPLRDLRERHREAVDLDLGALVSLARAIARAVRAEEGLCHTVSKTRVEDLIRGAVERGRLPAEVLANDLREDVLEAGRFAAARRRKRHRKSVAAVLRRERERRGLAEEDVAVRSGLRPDRASKVFRGSGDALLGELVRVCDALALRLEVVVDAREADQGPGRS